MTSNGIGRLGERSLHAALKEWLAQPGDEIEVPVDGFVIDVVRGDTLYEIQTRHLYAMRRKLAQLLEKHTVWLIHPISCDKWIVREDADSQFLARRKSPKHGRFIDIFREIVRIPHLLLHPNLTLQVLLIQEEEIWRDDGQGSWRRKGWSRADRRLLDVVDGQTFTGTGDYAALLPPDLEGPFTNKELAAALKCPVSLAQKMTYTLRKVAVLETAEKRGRAMTFVIRP